MLLISQGMQDADGAAGIADGLLHVEEVFGLGLLLPLQLLLLCAKQSDLSLSVEIQKPEHQSIQRRRLLAWYTLLSRLATAIPFAGLCAAPRLFVTFL